MPKLDALQPISRTDQKRYAHDRVKVAFLDRLRTGGWPKNELIPSENQLAKEYNLSRETIRKALRTLESEGYLQAEQGRGRTVSKTPENMPSASKPKTVGLLVSSLGADAYGEFSEIYNTVSQNNQNLTIYSLKQDVPDRLENISHHNTAGVLVHCQQILKSDIIEFSKTIPTVALMHRCSDFGIPSFYLSWALAAYQCSMHLFDKGFKYQFLETSTAEFHTSWNNEFIEGVSCAHIANNQTFGSEQIIETTRKVNNLERVDFGKIFSALEEHQKVGIVTYFSHSTISLVKMALARGIKIPEQLGITCIVDTDQLKDSPIPITAIAFDRLPMVKQAAMALLKLINGEEVAVKDNPFHGKLIIRSST